MSDFLDIASERSKIATPTTLWFNPPTEGFPWDNLRKILPGCRQVTNVLNGSETLPKISIGWVGCTNVTDRRQTDGRRHIANVNMSSRSLIKLLLNFVVLVINGVQILNDAVMCNPHGLREALQVGPNASKCFHLTHCSWKTTYIVLFDERVQFMNQTEIFVINAITVMCIPRVWICSIITVQLQ